MATDVKNDANLSTNLVSFWELEESSGTRVDSHGSNDLTAVNTPGQGTGIQGNCLDVEETNQEGLSITDATQSGLDLSGDHSIAFWCNPDVTDSTNTIGMFVSKFRGVGDDRSYLYRYFNGDFIIDLSSNGASSTQKTYSFSMTGGTWYHVAFVYDASAGSVDIYVNGSNETTLTGFPNSIYNGAETFFVASGRNGDWDGLLDELGIWNKTLTSTEVSDLYNSGSGIPYEASVLGYPFSQAVII